MRDFNRFLSYVGKLQEVSVGTQKTSSSQQKSRVGMPEPTRFSHRIKDVDGNYDIDGVSQDENAEVVVATQDPVPRENSFIARWISRLKKAEKQVFPE